MTDKKLIISITDFIVEYYRHSSMVNIEPENCKITHHASGIITECTNFTVRRLNRKFALVYISTCYEFKRWVEKNIKVLKKYKNVEMIPVVAGDGSLSIDILGEKDESYGSVKKNI
jgi:hypothetical protein